MSLRKKISGGSDYSYEEVFSHWLIKSSKTPVLSSSLPLAKFMALASSHDMMIADGMNHPVRSKQGMWPILTKSMWESAKPKSQIELLPILHKEDKKYNGLVNGDILREDDKEKTLGNLVLVAESDSCSDCTSWDSVKSHLKSRILIDREDDIEQLLYAETTLSKDAEKLICNYRIRSHYKELLAYSEWNSHSVQERSTRMLTSAWDTLSNWL